MYRIDLLLECIPDSLNKALRGNRMRYFSKNKHWDYMIRAQIVLNKKQLPPEPLKKARIKITRHSHRTLDYDGLVGSMKPVVDALVSAGVIADDSWNVTGQWNVWQEFRPKKDGPRLEVSVYEQ
jgi:hypothetical protein